ncbi:lipopolysaccharide transport periplasmic protein LptA [Roseobacter sp. HKCCD9010]|uniref:lipopolysaccharide transport periplasmic protein LptA n=1 Tax=unclassified Roseobacter TaxID=196798 RepID=UPI0014918CE8|nr:MULTISPECIES: lipopolysaccharide transport periplasmic protein LptA [unclassified Roseobacter]MBF9048414.1 lipopolysaccharide transport periplasmic protein LptA [Rhodobacterales bacterium HKCCD4356]NNV10413.1 lipopolysaccharide transport periplasmic protein LptA [Roseobacter sp. HKCCD7357]NNV14598.1 lipopolysaccharide transport periplasmic protein LptA [Roseobacter sp. HKCCD8768]NNV24057.1 lipopolysaccharide transport periplasmic protein LptA [Roseobacter sp. HKCCD8192]NNV28314.1 lipopolysa
MRSLVLAVLALCFSAITAAAQVNIGFGGVAHDATQALEVTSDNLTLNQETGNAVFSGNVIIVQGDLRIAAGEVIVFYGTENGAQDVTRVEATGGVLVTRGTDAAEGQSAAYEVVTSLMTLTGDVLVTQGATAISGDRMVVNMATGDGTVEGRVRTILQSEETDQ